MSSYPLETIRHSAAHIMAAAVRELFPDTKFDIGPSTDDGFYYDFDMEHRLVPEDLDKLESVMKKISGENVSPIGTHILKATTIYFRLHSLW
jgi:threonyl-tRNA synthetase